MKKCRFLKGFISIVSSVKCKMILTTFMAAALVLGPVLGAVTTQAAKVERDIEIVTALRELEHRNIGCSKVFCSQEFRSKLKNLPHWSRVLASSERQIEDFYNCKDNCSSAALSWQKIIRQSQYLPPLEQLKSVNSFFNRWPYRLDIDVYGVSDYWATPAEFLRLSGDCEDYSITKYYALRNLGFSIDDMRVVLITDNIRNISHAVLAVKLGEENYILDNLTDMLLSHLRYEHYVPQLSLNEFYSWTHVSQSSIP
jgi:predicted transglutaminase-like cysteine proteinase